MSYCRYSAESDVYLIGTDECLECFGADWRTEDAQPVHGRIKVPTYFNVDAYGRRIPDDDDLPDLTDEAILAAWRTRILAVHPLPWNVVQEGEHEEADVFRTVDRSVMLQHLLQHRAAGHVVPQLALDRLQREIQEFGVSYSAQPAA